VEAWRQGNVGSESWDLRQRMTESGRLAIGEARGSPDLLVGLFEDIGI
jgi:hypothetical protein